MLTFPLDHHSNGWDSAFYEVTLDNPAITTEMEGGYMASRPRHTRGPRKTFHIGWHSTGDIEKFNIELFYKETNGSSVAFTWHDPDTDTDYTVRFKSGDGLTMKYVGMGPTRLWDIELLLEEV